MHTWYYANKRKQIRNDINGILFAFDSRDSRHRTVIDIRNRCDSMMNEYEQFARIAVGNALVMFFDGLREAMEVRR